MTNSQLLTIREMSDICKVSRQTMYNVVKEIEEDDILTGLVTVKEGVKHFTPSGQEYIKKKFNITDKKSEEAEDEDSNENKENFEYRDKYIQMLEEQTKIKDEQIKGLNIAIEEIQQRQKETNILNAMKIKQLESSEKKEESKSIFSKIKDVFKQDINK